MTNKPVWKHNCEDCLYLKTVTIGYTDSDVDLYCHLIGPHSPNIVLARYSDNPKDIRSKTFSASFDSHTPKNAELEVARIYAKESHMSNEALAKAGKSAI